MKHWILIFLLIAATGEVIANQSQKSEADFYDVTNYLLEVAFDDIDYDITEVELSLIRISTYLKSPLITESKEISLRKIRAYVLIRVNSDRKVDGLPINYSQANMALNDLQYILNIKADDTQSAYAAGQLAFHYLGDPILANQYWVQCAAEGHGGCMNILASDYFTGQEGVTASLDESIYWHKKVFELGTRFNCAAVYSARTLSNITALIPDVDTGASWVEWEQRAQSLANQVEAEREDFSCDSNLFAKGMNYIYRRSNGIDNPAKLIEAIELAEDESETTLTLLKALYEPLPEAQLISYFDSLEPEQASEYAYMYYLKGKLTNDPLFVSIGKEYLSRSNREDCEFCFAMLEHMGLNWEQ